MICEDFDCSLKAPFSLVISGMPQSGKSTLTSKILLKRNSIIDTGGKGPISKITYCYTEDQPKFFISLKELIPEIIFHKGLPDDYSDGTDNPSIMVLDDLMSEASKSEDACAAFTRTSHHRNVSIIILVQNFFHKNMRKITTSCQYICIMKNPRDSSFISCLGRQLNEGKKNQVLDLAYKECSENPYGYTFIDCTQNQNDKFRIRNNIFPEKDCIIYTKK
jgi:hypothetical protein